MAGIASCRENEVEGEKKEEKVKPNPSNVIKLVSADQTCPAE